MAGFLVFDTETTGVDVFNDRIVQLFISRTDERGHPVESWEWFINPGVEISAGAEEIHGLSAEYLREKGREPEAVLREAMAVFESAIEDDLVLVAFNLNFDLSILTAEMERHGVHKGYGQFVVESLDLFDPLVVDRRMDKWRKGKRTLEAMAPHYGLEFDPEQAHDASYDVGMTGLLAAKVRERYGLQSTESQAFWYKEWAKGLEQYLRRTDPSAQVNPGWPLKEKED